jgi:type IV secretion system protein TrbI
MSTTDPVGVPEIQDKRTKPAGLLPKNAQHWALALIALIMILVILFSGRTAPKPRSKEPLPQPIADPSPASIDEVRRRIDELANKNRAKQEEITSLQGAIAGQAALPRGGQPYTISAPPPSHGGRSYMDSDNQRGLMDADEQKRESRAPFASNVALSYRADPQAYASEPQSTALAAKLAEASKYSSGSVTPERSGQKPDADRNAEDQTRTSKSKKTVPSHPHRPGEIDYPLFEGTVLETVLQNRLDGYFSGPVNCMLTTDVYSPNGAHVLIPSGTRVLGEVRRVDTFGQQRLAVVFHRLIMPDGYSVLLDQFKGLNQIGETGLRDQVNHHYVQMFGVSLAIGAVAGLAQSNTQYGLEVTGPQAYEQGVANSLSQTSMHILDRYLNVLPTFTVREGHRVKIYLTQDLMLPACDKHPLETGLEAPPIADTSTIEMAKEESK